MATHFKLASSGISASAGRSARAVSNQEKTNDTDVKMEAKREPEIDEFEGIDHGEENNDRKDGYNNGLLEEDEKKHVLHARRESCGKNRLHKFVAGELIAFRLYPSQLTVGSAGPTTGRIAPIGRSDQT